MKRWGGRFEKPTDATMEHFQSSIGFDQRLYIEDITGSIVYATMLGEQGILPQEDVTAIIDGLRSILMDAAEGKIEWCMEDEDIHMNVETLLVQRIGEAGKRLHTGRSRNDQVALDMRVYMKRICTDTVTLLKTLCKTLLDLSEKHIETFMPGYTHLQRAQPITLAHHLMAYVQMFLRDIDRIADTRRRTDVMPLGSGALAGTTYPIDRTRLAEMLGFSQISENSMDAVSDRDFVLDYLSTASIIMMHLSRFCEELCLWSSLEFGFVVLDDAYATGSSIMPQKKNPDAAELIRGKTGRVYGDLFTLLTVLKGLPLAYNKDMQEDKEALFDAHDTLIQSLTVFNQMIASAQFQSDRMARAAAEGFTNATDAADYLVGKGLPFRDAHEVVGKLVLYCEKYRQSIGDLPLEKLHNFSPLFEEDLFEAITLNRCIERRALIGGPAKEAVQTSIEAARARL